MRFRTHCRFGFVIGCLLVAAGCSGDKVPSLGRVTGTITLDGQPLSDATVIFDGTKPGEPAVIAKTDASGNYELYYSRGHKGATIGEHTVHISSYQPPTDEVPKAKKETIPAKYNVKSELKATVTRGQNKIDFDLKSGGEIIQPDEEDQPKKGKKGRSKAGCA
jgi:hypothetical protein